MADGNICRCLDGILILYSYESNQKHLGNFSMFELILENRTVVWFAARASRRV